MRKLFFLSLLLFSLTAFSQLKAAKYSIHNVKVNTKYSDFGAAFFGPNKIIFASSQLDGKKLRNKFKKKQTPNTRYDLYKGFLNFNGEINYTQKILNNFTTKYNESNVSFTPDLKHVYFTQNNIKKGKYIKDSNNWVNLKIYRADVKTNGEWTNIVSLPFNNDSYSCAHPSVSEDGKILFFSSDMPGTMGQSDIFWVRILDDGGYGEPENIGTFVNSKYRESFPYVDDDILYFSSDRPDSMGGMDVFMVALDQPNSTPVNLGSVINSPYDDFCFVIDRKHKRGFFSSNRPNGKGNDDLYFFKQETPIVKCKQKISGVVIDNKTNQPVAGAIVEIHTHNSIKIATVPVKKDGKFSFDLACRGNYRIEAFKPDYKRAFRPINFHKGEYSQHIVLHLSKKESKETQLDPKKPVAVATHEKPEPMKKKSVVVYKNGHEILDIPPVYFELDQYYITEESAEVLQKVAKILKENPSFIIQVGSYTDCRASASYNLHLSALRAKEVVKHLEYLGIPEYRLKRRGFGESQPVNNCVDGVKCTEAEHLKNRRTEFIILKK